MISQNRSLLVPLMLIVVGTGWLLSTLGIAPEIDWIWTLGLAATGITTFVIGGLDKFTFVVGTFFVVTSLLSVVRQTGQMSLDIEIPILVILSGVLLLIARSPKIPMPSWYSTPPKE